VPNEHIVTINFHMAVDYEPEGGAFSMKEYLLDVGQCIIDSMPKEWFEPTEENLHITGADIGCFIIVLAIALIVISIILVVNSVSPASSIPARS